MMRGFLAEQQQKQHYPPYYMVNGVQQPNPETPDRVDLLVAGARAAGLSLTEPASAGLAPIRAAHSEPYLSFLKNAYPRWLRIDGAADAVTPNIHPRSTDGDYPLSVVAQAGWHMLDASCPVVAKTYESACWSAWSAVAAADAVLLGKTAAYALCRPPGHHATIEAAGGFCYFNNTAIAAARLHIAHARVAVLDIDLHHGNGTQEIFYARDDVLTVSVHADPARFYPFFWGHASECGRGKGEGFNLNLPLPRRSDDEAFLAALATAIDRIKEYAPGALVVALGLDSYEGDPIAGLSVTTGGFAKIGSLIARSLRMPTVLVQEGGYPCRELSLNLEAFLTGFQDG